VQSQHDVLLVTLERGVAHVGGEETQPSTTPDVVQDSDKQENAMAAIP
jgi:hypothetical protein